MHKNAGGTRALLQRLLPLPWMSQPASTYKSCVQAAQHPKPTTRSKQHMPVHTHEQHFAAAHFAERRWKVLHAQAMLRFEVAPDEAFPSSFHSLTFLCGCNMTALQYCRHHIMYSNSSKRQGISSLAALLGRASGTDVHARSALTEVQTSLLPLAETRLQRFPQYVPFTPLVPNAVNSNICPPDTGPTCESG